MNCPSRSPHVNCPGNVKPGWQGGAEGELFIVFGLLPYARNSFNHIIWVLISAPTQVLINMGLCTVVLKPEGEGDFQCSYPLGNGKSWHSIYEDVSADLCAIMWVKGRHLQISSSLPEGGSKAGYLAECACEAPHVSVIR